ncbi:uncharacterized protein BYT42DRAFT_576921 [Radiomyces spectabilis]|uniref:uncharacterized protein n=1 Tax=Radiomyces spectabilis TaxID=64574 RepID=UPI0022203CFE|nr:uncharacterized protein BYT42DRAFT_576921 [Radiomyces spectabilis]KAI8374594.1 hypothetical protein BYT42DRAFT_576921 [Radiomyces spectabilis]
MDLLDLDGQTAPESTHGLFDPPMIKMPGKPGDTARRSSLELSGGSSYYDKSQQQRSKSAYAPLNPIAHRHRSALHTVNEEEDHKRPVHGYDTGFYEPALSGLGVRKQRVSVANFNNFPMTQTQHSSVNLGLENQRRSSFLDYNQRMGFAEDDDEYSISRADALAEAEAKLTGAYHNRPTDEDRRYRSSYHEEQQKHNRRLSEPSTRYHHHRYSDQDYNNDRRSLHYTNKRTSLQYTASYDATTNKPGHRQAGKPTSLNLDIAKQHRSSRNYNDWRAPSSAWSTSHSAIPLVPFTPTRFSFPRDEGTSQQRRALFTAHLPFSSLVPLLKSHQLVSGILRVNKRNRSDAYVFCEDFNADIYICGSRDRNRALEGDVVAVRLVEVDKVMREKQEKEEAKLARNNGQPVLRRPDEEDEKEIIFGGEEDIDKVTPRYCGIVVAILERAQNQLFSGTLGLMRPSNKRPKSLTEGEDAQQSSTKESSPRIIWFKPTDKRVPLIAIPVEQAPKGFLENSEQFEDRLFLGSIKRWPITSLHPFGILMDELGPVKDLEVQFQAILADNNFSDDPFSEAVLQCLPGLPWSVDQESLRGRLDLRETRCWTLDSLDTGDYENAISVETIADNIYQVGFHVADVSAFVTPHSAIDKEARSRATAVRLHKSVPLWPEELRKGCTELLPHEERFAFSVICKFNASGDLIKTEYERTVIKSRGILTIAQMQRILDDGVVPDTLSDADTESLVHDVKRLYSISQKLKDARRQKGALFLEEPELSVTWCDGQPSKIAILPKIRANEIVEEFTLLANQMVAQKISRHFPEHALLRSQSPPNHRKLRELVQYLQNLGYQINPSSSGTLRESIDAITNDAARSVITALVRKTMNMPKYFCTGVFDISRYHHYGMNVPLYTHFTSPSRRYTDLIVHRQLEAALNGEKRFYIECEMIQKMARYCNVKSQAVLNAREQMNHLVMSRLLNPSMTHEAIVVGVQEQSFDVVVPTLGLERRIHVINLPLKSAIFSAADSVLHLFWTPGVATSDRMVEQRPYDDEFCNTVNGLSIQHQETSSPVSEPVKRRPRSLSLRAIKDQQQEVTIAEEYRQIIRPFDYVRVVITANPIRNPPLIRILAANPFV